MEPHVQPLSLWRRKLVFGSLLLAFLICLPAFIFYATGYRYDFSSAKPTFTATGGFYIIADTPESIIYLDNKPVENIRSFRSASYIQGIEPGQHRVHVQAPGVHTWVKELPVGAHLVTEVEAFNLPLIPQVRLIPEYLTATGTPVVLTKDASTPVLLLISTTTSPIYFATSSVATSTYRANQEYTLLRDLLKEQASSTAFRKATLARTSQSFGFSTTTIATGTQPEVATTTVSRDTVTLFERDGDVFAAAVETNFRQVPYYFCVPQVTVSELFESAVTTLGAAAEQAALSTTTEVEVPECRPEILINRQGKTVKSFDFFPLNQNLVLMHLDDGVYVVEIDDRAWQNIQPLYLGSDLELILYRSGIFIKQGNLIFEVLPEIIPA